MYLQFKKISKIKLFFGILFIAVLFHVVSVNGASVFQVYQGGTGTSTTPTAGQVLEGRMDGTYGPARFSAGTNITIDTSTLGTIQISATGGGSGEVVSTSSPIYSGGLAYFNGSSSITSALPMLYDALTGRITFGTSTITGLTFTNASGTNIGVTGYGLFPTLTFTNASGTNINASGYGTFPTLNFTNASGTRLTLPDYLDVGTSTISGHLSVATNTFSGLFNVGVGSPFFTVFADPVVELFPLYSRIPGPYTLGKGSLTIGTSSANTPDDALFYIATSSPMFFINSQTGRVGIATTTPTNALSVQGNVNISGSVSSTNVGVSGYGTFPTLNFTTSAGGNLTNVSSSRIDATTGGAIASVSSTRITASTGYDGARFDITNGSSTNIDATGRIKLKGDDVSTSTGANPTATIGTSATNGTANTFLRSDGAPALGTQFASSSFAVNNYSATSTGEDANFLILAPDYEFTASKIFCQNTAATSTYRIITSTSAVATSGTAVATLFCSVNSSSTTTFGTSTVSSGSFLIGITSSTEGTPTRDLIWFNGYKN